MDLTAFIAENLFSAHAFLAGLTGKDILKLDQAEADQLGKSIQDVARHYDIPGVNQKAVDWIRLARTLGMVYGTRLFALKMQANIKAASAPTAPQPTTLARPTLVPDKPKPAEAQQPPQGPRTMRASPGPGLPDVEIEWPN